MRKLLLIVGLLFSLNIFGASLNGVVKLEDSDSLGVFVYVEGQNKYDITDSKGKFTINGLKLGEEYNLVFQKGNLPDYKKNIKISSEITNVEIEIPNEKIKVSTTQTNSNNNSTNTTSNTKTTASSSNTSNKTVAVKVVKVDVNGKINSQLNSDIFLQLSGQSYGIIVKPNTSFKMQLNPGKYTASLIQEGAKTKKINFTVGKTSTNVGTFVMEAIDYNNLTLRLEEKVENGVVQLYKDGFLEYSSKIDKNSKEILIEGLKRGSYDILVKAFGKEDFNSVAKVDGNVAIDVVFNKLSKENKIFVNIHPKDIEVELRLYSGLELIRTVNAKELSIIEGLESNKVYSLEAVNPKYKTAEIKRIIPGDNVNLSLAREVKGTLISGFVSPFNSNANVMLLDKGEVLAETTTDETGYYEIELPNQISGEKTLRINAENFSGEYVVENFENTKNIYEKNIMLKPYTTKINGVVTFGKGQALGNTLVMIESLGIWQFTNGKGEYYFNNLQEDTHELTFKKLGYTTVNEKIKATKDETSVKNIVLNPIGKIVFRSNLEAFKLNVNGKEFTVNQKIYELIQGMGTFNISATKTGYLPINTKLSLTEAGEIRDVFLEFINIQEQNKEIKTKIEKIKSNIKELKITEAEELLSEISQMKGLKAYEKDYLDISSRLKNAKARLFDIDRSIKFELEKVKDNIKKEEASKVGYVEKNKNLTKLYKESLDYLGKIVFSHPYTTYRYDIHMLQSDIYLKMGMPNSSKNYTEEAKKYENRRKE